MRGIFAALAALLLAAPAVAEGENNGFGANLIPFVEPTPAPVHPITLEDGRTVTLADYRGRVAVAMFWATWCEVCEKEMPEMAALAERHDPARLTLVPVSVDDGAPFAKVRRYLDDRMHHSMPVMVDVSKALFESVGAYATPTTIIVDKFGQVVAGYIGAADWETPQMTAYLDGLVAAESAEDSLALLGKMTAAD